MMTGTIAGFFTLIGVYLSHVLASRREAAIEVSRNHAPDEVENPPTQAAAEIEAPRRQKPSGQKRKILLGFLAFVWVAFAASAIYFLLIQNGDGRITVVPIDKSPPTRSDNRSRPPRPLTEPWLRGDTAQGGTQARQARDRPHPQRPPLRRHRRQGQGRNAQRPVPRARQLGRAARRPSARPRRGVNNRLTAS